MDVSVSSLCLGAFVVENISRRLLLLRSLSFPAQSGKEPVLLFRKILAGREVFLTKAIAAKGSKGSEILRLLSLLWPMDWMLEFSCGSAAS